MPKQLVYKDKDGNDVPLDAVLVQRVIKVVNRGLCDGVGQPKPGFMCVEAAVNYALGQTHNDNPPCVGVQPREAKIELNDKNWSSKKARARGLLAVAIAQLGSDTIDGEKFSEALKNSLRKRVVKMVHKKVIKREVPYSVHDKNPVSSFEFHEVRFERETYSDYLVSRACLILEIAGHVGDAELSLVADCILDALKKVKSPGVKFLGLINEN